MEKAAMEHNPPQTQPQAHPVELPGAPMPQQHTEAPLQPSAPVAQAPPQQQQQQHQLADLSSPIVSPSSPAPVYTPPFTPPPAHGTTNHAYVQHTGTAPHEHQTPPGYTSPPPQGMPYQAPPVASPGAPYQTPTPTGGPPGVMYDAQGQPLYYNQQTGQYHPASPGQYPPQQQYFQPQPGMPQQQGIPMQTPAQSPPAVGGAAAPAPAKTGTQFQNATPVAALGRGAAPVDCPACGQRAMTQISYEIGNSTHAWALGICCLTCLGCIPYLMNSLKDVQHKCGRCGVLLATWHRSGSTEVHIHN